MKYNEIKNKHGGMDMDVGYEDRMYRQIEKSLSNNINERLYVPIEMVDKPVFLGKGSKQIVDSVSYEKETSHRENDFLDRYKANDDKGNISSFMVDNREEGPRLSRAEYIIQAREACLRQLNSIESSGRIYDSYGDSDSAYSSHGSRRRSRVERLFNEEEEEAPAEELASYRSLIIRTVCAVVIFLSIFIIDKIRVDWGAFSYEAIRNFVTGNNHLKALEDLIVSWLK